MKLYKVIFLICSILFLLGCTTVKDINSLQETVDLGTGDLYDGTFTVQIENPTPYDVFLD